MNRIKKIKDRDGEDAFAKYGSKSWSSPGRSRKVGFASMSIERVKELGAKGGRAKKRPQEEEINADEQAGKQSLDSVQPVDKRP